MSTATWRLDGRTALVTGGSRGIGRAIVEEFVALGARVLSVARGAQDLAGVIAVAADVTTADGRARIVAAARELGPLHVLVHNAGTNVRGPLTSYDDATIERLLALNLTAPLLLSRDLHPLLAAANGASVVHVGSVAGHTALPTGVAYGAAKAGLAQASRTLALEWARDGIIECQTAVLTISDVDRSRSSRRADRGDGGAPGCGNAPAADRPPRLRSLW